MWRGDSPVITSTRSPKKANWKKLNGGVVAFIGL
jgi:hypothetical protein